jgi:hypothetical protein
LQHILAICGILCCCVTSVGVVLTFKV